MPYVPNIPNEPRSETRKVKKLKGYSRGGPIYEEVEERITPTKKSPSKVVPGPRGPRLTTNTKPAPSKVVPKKSAPKPSTTKLSKVSPRTKKNLDHLNVGIQNKVNEDAVRRGVATYSLSPTEFASEMQNMYGEMSGQQVEDSPLNQLMGDLQSSIPGVQIQVPDRREVEGMVAAEFDPKLRAIKQEMARAEGSSAQAQRMIGASYDDLVKHYIAQGAQTKSRYASSKAQAAARTQELKNAISSDYTNRLNEQVEMFKRLGIEAASASTLPGQYAQQAEDMARAEQSGAVEQGALGIQDDSLQSYYGQMQGAAKSFGAEEQTRLQMQLQDYLARQGANLAETQGNYASAVQRALMESQNQAQQQAFDQQKFEAQQKKDTWSQMMDLYGIESKEADRRLKSMGSGSSKGLSGVATFLGNAGSPHLVGTFQEALASASHWMNSPQGKQMYGSSVDPQEMAAIISDHAANKKLSKLDQARLYQATLAYYGQG